MKQTGQKKTKKGGLRRVVRPISGLQEATRSFIGYLEGTQKAGHTIRGYRSDLRSFASFLEKELSDRPISLLQVTKTDLEKYGEFLKQAGAKTNTRRRKIITVRRLLGYLVRRNKFHADFAERLAPPGKIERVPKIVELAALRQAIQALPHEQLLDARNRLLLWTLVDTGCLVSEVSRLRFSDWTLQGGQPSLSVTGKSPRVLPVSQEVIEAVHHVQSLVKPGEEHVFQGFNKFGPMTSALTDRGVELLVAAHGPRLGVPDLTPRLIRHSVTLELLKSGLSTTEVQERLGLRTAYAFRAFQPLLASK